MCFCAKTLYTYVPSTMFFSPRKRSLPYQTLAVRAWIWLGQTKFVYPRLIPKLTLKWTCSSHLVNLSTCTIDANFQGGRAPLLKILGGLHPLVSTPVLTGYWRTIRLLSPLSCRLHPQICWGVNCLLYLWTRSLACHRLLFYQSSSINLYRDGIHDERHMPKSINFVNPLQT